MTNRGAKAVRHRNIADLARVDWRF